MPRQQVNDNRSLHNLGGIDLRKNADQNCAEDMVNVWIDSQHFFTNRKMPTIYNDGTTSYSGDFKFACENKSLEGLEKEVNISSAERMQSVSSIAYADDDSNDMWVAGQNLEVVKDVMAVNPDTGAMARGNVDFSFYYDRTNDRLVIDFPDGYVSDGLTLFYFISYYGQVNFSFQPPGTDYYFGEYGEYRLRVIPSKAGNCLAIEAKQPDSSYVPIQTWVNSDYGEWKERTHGSKHLGLGSLKIQGALESRFYFSENLLKLDYNYGNVASWQGGYPTGDKVASQDIIATGELLLGTDSTFKMEAENGKILSIKQKDYNDSKTYKTIQEFNYE